MRSVQEAIACGVAYLPEDCLTEGLFLSQTINWNLRASSYDAYAQGRPARPRRSAGGREKVDCDDANCDTEGRAAGPAFWQWGNLFSLLRSNVVIGIFVLGVLTVMISGGIDVSIPAFAMATPIGLALGVLNACIVYNIGMIPLIVTLGMGAMVRGCLLRVVGASTINIVGTPPRLIAFGKLELPPSKAPTAVISP